jgi:hypothetical protein
MRQVAVVLGLILVIALAIVVGKRMSSEAMAVVVGVVCGVAASIPTAVLLLVGLSRRDRQRMEEPDAHYRQGSYPPVVVIQGGAPQALPPALQSGYWPSAPPDASRQREFNLVGDGEYWHEERH